MLHLEKVVRTKTIDIEPMELDEAILQMELLGHDFHLQGCGRLIQLTLFTVAEDGDIDFEVKDK